jgi:nucleotide-binding universal stress UspA family protein
MAVLIVFQYTPYQLNSHERLSTRVVTGVGSRAAAILAEAEAGNYDTIVVGRRGVSEVLDFSMGRVTNKLTQITKQNALWIVG